MAAWSGAPPAVVPESAGPAQSSGAPSAVTLSADESVAVAEIAVAFADALPDSRSGPFRDLARQAATGSVAAHSLPDLERVCVLALETGRARTLGSAAAEQALVGVYRRTPGGRELAAETADINAMLAQLAGRELRSARITCRMPSRFQLDLVVDGIDIAITLEPEGLVVRSLQTG